MNKYTPAQRIAKFWNKVDKSGGDDACWDWTGYINKNGFGECMWNNRRPMVIHRISYLLTHGVLPKSQEIYATCDNKACANPKHLRAIDNVDRFWLKVLRTNCDDDCWIWIGGKTSKGYGSFFWNGRAEHAQRVSFMIAHGPFPQALHVLHTCDNPSCVNPKHLFLGTNQDNVDDKIRKGRQHVWRGEDHPTAKLSDLELADMRCRFESGIATAKQLAEEFHMNRKYIGRLLRYRFRVPNTDPALAARTERHADVAPEPPDIWQGDTPDNV